MWVDDWYMVPRPWVMGKPAFIVNMKGKTKTMVMIQPLRRKVVLC